MGVKQKGGRLTVAALCEAADRAEALSPCCKHFSDVVALGVIETLESGPTLLWGKPMGSSSLFASAISFCPYCGSAVGDPAVKTRPIIMRAEEVRATLNGSKTQLRRPVKPQPDGGPRAAMVSLGDEWWGLFDGDLSGEWRCPFGGPGDILWAKETWQAVHFAPEYSEGYRTGYSDDWWAAPTIPKDDEAGWWTPVYAADPHHEDHRDDRGFAWRSPIYMPRWASRLTLEVLAVRVERVQDISEQDARAEGVDPLIPGHGPVTMEELRLDPGMRTASMFRDGFAYAWSELHDKPADFGAAWERNDFVWVAEYRRLERQGGSILPYGTPAANTNR